MPFLVVLRTPASICNASYDFPREYVAPLPICNASYDSNLQSVHRYKFLSGIYRS
jgi:hypothetical protein